MSDYNHENNAPNFLAGILVGVALTYLFTTKTGKKLKTELLKETAKALEKLGEEIEEKAPQLKVAKGSLRSEESEPRPLGREKLEDKKEEVQKKVEATSEEIKTTKGEPRPEEQEEIREVPELVKKIQNKGRRFFFRRSQTRQES